MAAEKGLAFLIKHGDGATTEVFTTIAAMRSTNLTINSETVEITNKDSGGMRELLAGAGVRSMSLSGSGVFTKSAEQVLIQNEVLAGTISNYEIVFEPGDKFAGAFQCTSLEYAGEHNGERTYNMSFESSGAITVTAV